MLGRKSKWSEWKDKEKVARKKWDEALARECLHNQCPECDGTGVKKRDGSVCVHYISCPCPRCTIRC